MPRTFHFGDPPTTALLYAAKRGARRALVLAHGAGAPQTHPFMVRIATGLARRGIDVLTFNFGYAERASRRPDTNAVLESAWMTALAFARKRFPKSALFIGGKSMGGRIASQIAVRDDAGDIAGLVFLGYPLHPPSDPKKLRVLHWPRIKAPLLFVQGERDPFGSPKEIARAAKKLTAHQEIVRVPDGDHSFAVRKSSGVDQDRAFEDAMDAIDRFTSAIVTTASR